jgi:hypothetical protein
MDPFPVEEYLGLAPAAGDDEAAVDGDNKH